MKQFRFLVYGKDERQRCLKEILENRGHVAKNAEESSAGFFVGTSVSGLVTTVSASSVTGVSVFPCTSCTISCVSGKASWIIPAWAYPPVEEVNIRTAIIAAIVFLDPLKNLCINFVLLVSMYRLGSNIQRYVFSCFVAVNPVTASHAVLFHHLPGVSQNTSTAADKMAEPLISFPIYSM